MKASSPISEEPSAAIESPGPPKSARRSDGVRLQQLVRHKLDTNTIIIKPINVGGILSTREWQMVFGDSISRLVAINIGALKLV